VGKRDSLKRPGPSKAAESIVAMFVPPACREEVLGDFHERYVSSSQYAFDALRTVPLVVLSRIRRTTDPQLLLMHALGLYLSFVGAAWFKNRAFLDSEGGLLRLVIPVVVAMLGIVLEDAYAKPGLRPPMRVVRGPMVGIGLALLIEAGFWAGCPRFSIPYRVAFDGCAVSLSLCCTIRMLFPPVANQLATANTPGGSLQEGGTAGTVVILVLKSIAALVAIAICGTWLAGISGLPVPRVVFILLLCSLFLLIGYQVSKRV
jgi:hypothetical protein